MVNECYRAAADDLKTVTPGLEAVVTVLEVAEVVFVERPDPVVDFALDVGARKDDAFDFDVGVALIDVLLSGPDLLPPERLDRHVSAGVLQHPIWPPEPRTDNPNLGRAVGGGLKPRQP